MGSLPPAISIKKINQERLLTAAQAMASIAHSQQAEQDAGPKSYNRKLVNICNAAMPRVKQAGRNAVYWWSPELNELRRECALTWRKLQYRRRKKTRSREEEEQARQQYRTAVMALQNAIRTAKRRAWEELIKTIDWDPWGRPYRIVLNKLRNRAPLSRRQWNRSCSKESWRPYSLETQGNHHQP